MVTLIRWLMLKSKETKCRLAFWRLMEQLLAEVGKQLESPSQKPEGGE